MTDSDLTRMGMVEDRSSSGLQGPILLAWINFDPSMEK